MLETSPRVATGGKPLYGAALGILMLEARFPRIPGDMGNAHTWPFPVLYKVVRGASPQQVVRERAEGLAAAAFAGDDRVDLPGFDALDELAAEGMTTVRVGVRSDEAPPELLDRADVVVEGPAGVVNLLSALTG